MKRIAIFVGLKIAEISAIVFIPYFIGILDKNTIQWTYNDWQEPLSIFDIWFNGCGYIVALTGGFAGILLICLVTHSNWEWAKKLSPTKSDK